MHAGGQEFNPPTLHHCINEARTCHQNKFGLFFCITERMSDRKLTCYGSSTKLYRKDRAAAYFPRFPAPVFSLLVPPSARFFERHPFSIRILMICHKRIFMRSIYKLSQRTISSDGSSPDPSSYVCPCSIGLL